MSDTPTPEPVHVEIPTYILVVGDLEGYETEHGETAVGLRAIALDARTGYADELALVLTPDWLEAIGAAQLGTVSVTDGGEKSQSDRDMLDELLRSGVIRRRSEGEEA